MKNQRIAAPFFILVLLLLFTSLGLPQPVQGQDAEKTGKKDRKRKSIILYGQASFYANKFQGRRTANGEMFSQKKFTAACNSLPLGTWIQVTNLKNGKIVVVKTNDRLHPKTRRLIDLTTTAAKKLGYISRGLTRVRVEVLNQKLYNN